MSKVEYKNTLIKDIGRVVTGKTPETKKAEFYGNGYMFITPAELHDGYNVQVSDKYITESGLQSIKSNCIDGTSVMVGCIGWDMGNVAICHRKCATNQQINSITDFNPKYNPFYTYYWLLTKKDYLFTIASVTRTPILSKSTFEEIVIPMPDRSIQDNVVGILKPIDDMIENNKRICSELEAMAKTIYDYWFVQFDFPDENGNPYRTSGGEMVWNEQLKREIPKGWEVTNIGKITANFDSRRIPLSQNERNSMKGDIPYYGATGVMDYVDQFIFDGQYVLIAEDGSVVDGDGHPIVQMIWGKTWVNNHAHVLEGCNGYSNELLYFVLKDIPVIKIMTGSIQKKINQDNLNNYKIPQIPHEIANQFTSILKTIFSKLRAIEIENSELTKLRDWLLPMLMNGQARVE